MATKAGVAGRQKAAPGAVSPAPTPGGCGAAALFGGRLFSCILLVATMDAGTAIGQNRNAVGVIAPVATTDPAPDPRREPKIRDPKRAVKHESRKIPSKKKPVTQVASPLRQGPHLKAPIMVAAPQRSKRPDLVQQPRQATVAANMEQQCWQKIQATLQPARLIALCAECEREFPAGQFAAEIRQIAAGARHALDLQRSIGLSADFFEESVGDVAYREALSKAVRGDKDAAYRIASAYRAGTSGVMASPRRMEQWLRFAAELGNGHASWELAEFYNYVGLVADAARFEKKAIDMGYRAPLRLPTRGY